MSEYSLSYRSLMQTRSRRAEPLSAEERRRSILTAVIPLLIQKGSAVTSAEMAEAAGVAEGTIFRVFADKTAIINEAVRVTIDPGPTCEALAQIDPSTSLEDQLVIAARILLARIDHFMALAEVARSSHDREATHAIDSSRSRTPPSLTSSQNSWPPTPTDCGSNRHGR